MPNAAYRDGPELLGIVFEQSHVHLREYPTDRRRVRFVMIPEHGHDPEPGVDESIRCERGWERDILRSQPFMTCVIATEENEIRIQPVELPEQASKATRGHVGSLDMGIRQKQQSKRSREAFDLYLGFSNDGVGGCFIVANCRQATQGRSCR